MTFFNTEAHWGGGPILGLTLAMEEKKSQNYDVIPGEVVMNLKTGLMGPLAGIGDTISWSTLMYLFIGLFLPLAKQGNPCCLFLYRLLSDLQMLYVWILFCGKYAEIRTGQYDHCRSKHLRSVYDGRPCLNLCYGVHTVKIRNQCVHNDSAVYLRLYYTRPSSSGCSVMRMGIPCKGQEKLFCGHSGADHCFTHFRMSRDNYIKG